MSTEILRSFFSVGGLLSSGNYSFDLYCNSAASFFKLWVFTGSYFRIDYIMCCVFVFTLPTQSAWYKNVEETW